MLEKAIEFFEKEYEEIQKVLKEESQNAED